MKNFRTRRKRSQRLSCTHTHRGINMTIAKFNSLLRNRNFWTRSELKICGYESGIFFDSVWVYGLNTITKKKYFKKLSYRTHVNDLQNMLSRTRRIQMVNPSEWGICELCKISKLSFLNINWCKELRYRNTGYVWSTKTKNKISGCDRPFRAPFVFCIVSRRFLRDCLNSSFCRSTFPIHLTYRNTELHGGHTSYLLQKFPHNKCLINKICTVW